MTSQAVRKYLHNYAEPEAALLPDGNIIAQHYQHVLVIPVCDEPQDFFTHLIAGVEIDSPLLVVLVLNCPDSDDIDAEQSRVQRTTQTLRDRLLASTDMRWQAEDGTLALTRYCGSPCIDLLLIDRFSASRCIPHRQGVGLARKIGNDIALTLFARGLVEQPWLYNTDADVQLPRDYFATAPDPTASAGLYRFEHRAATPELELAMTLYELSLHYYVLGLRWAGSRYAYHSIGSIIAISAQHYAEIRGFPKRSGAEDFYLLNKLAKAGHIADVASGPICISGRASTRVPFGTGPALSKISQLEQPLEQFTFYDPNTFAALRQWLSAVPRLWEQRDRITADGLNRVLADALRDTGAQPPLLDTIVAALDSLGIAAAVEHSLAHSKREQTFVQHIHTWFDALRTLQFIHYLRDAALPSSAWRDSVAAAEFMKEEAPGHDTSWQQARALCINLGACPRK